MVVMAFLVEIDQQFERIFCLLQDDYDKKEPTVAFCIQMFTFKEEKKIAYRQQVARRWDVLGNVFSGWTEREISKPGRGSISSMPLKLDGRIIRFLFDSQSEDPYFKGTVRLHLPHRELAPMRIREGLVKDFADMYEEEKGGFVYISGVAGTGKKFLVCHYCKQQERNLLLVDVPELLSEVPSGRQAVRRLFREAHLQGDAMRQDTGGIRYMELILNPATVGEQEILWEGFLAGITFEEEIHAGQLADRYQLTPGAIVRAVEEVKKQQMDGGGGRTQKALFRAARDQLAHKLDNCCGQAFL